MAYWLRSDTVGIQPVLDMGPLSGSEDDPSAVIMALRSMGQKKNETIIPLQQRLRSNYHPRVKIKIQFQYEGKMADTF